VKGYDFDIFVYMEPNAAKYGTVD